MTTDEARAIVRRFWDWRIPDDVWRQAFAIVDAAQTSQAAMESHIQSNHPALWAWLSAQGTQDRADLHAATAALRGL